VGRAFSAAMFSMGLGHTGYPRVARPRVWRLCRRFKMHGGWSARFSWDSPAAILSLNHFCWGTGGWAAGFLGVLVILGCISSGFEEAT